MSDDAVSLCSKPPNSKENTMPSTKCTPNISKLPVSTRKLAKKQRSGSSLKKQPLAVINKQ